MSVVVNTRHVGNASLVRFEESDPVGLHAVQDQLSALWKFINATNTPPTVDFKKQSVIAVFAGKATSAAISVAKIEDSGARLVSITLMQPESTCPQPAESASPYEIVTVPATLLPLAHKDISKTIGCRD